MSSFELEDKRRLTPHNRRVADREDQANAASQGAITAPRDQPFFTSLTSASTTLSSSGLAPAPC